MKQKESLMSKLYADIGSKLKRLAFVTCIVEAIGAVVSGIVLLVDEQWWGIALIFLGPIVAWVTTWILYAFGELVDKTCSIDQSLKKGSIALQSDGSNPSAPAEQRVQATQKKQSDRKEKQQKRREIKQQQRAEQEAARPLVPRKVKLISMISAVVMAVVALAVLILGICLIASNWLYSVSLGLIWLALTVMIIPVYKFVHEKCMESFGSEDVGEDE